MKSNASIFKTISGIIVAFGLLSTSFIGLPLATTTAALATENSTTASEPVHTPLTAQTAHDISTGRIRLENNQIDSLLYHKPELDPNADSDDDGLKNSEELYTYVKNGRTYYGYKSHPLIKDTDGDGLNDNNDTNPRRWDISPRDMALFMELVYREDDYVKKVLDYSKPLTYIYEDRNEYKLMHNELAPYWKIKETYHESNGFDAVLFENVNPAYPFIEQNGVQVLGIRGTSKPNDFDDDFDLGRGANPGQANSIDALIDKYCNYNTVSNLYVTGHSLGGYLTQRALIRAKSRKATFNIKAYTFNAPKIWGNLGNGWLKEAEKFGNQLTKEGYAVHYAVDNDKAGGFIAIDHFEGAISIGSSEAGHGSRSYFEPRMDSFKGFTVGERNKIEGIGRKIDALDGLVNEPVIKTDEQSFEPKIKNIDIFENDKLPKVTDYLLNASDRPQGSTITDITDKTAIDTSKSGKYEGKILLTLSDNSVKTIIVPIIIHKRLANIEELPNVTVVEGKKVEVKKDTTIPADFDFKPYLQGLPENSTVKVVEQPDTTNIGEATFKVEVTFASGAKRKVILKAHVVKIIPATPLKPAKKTIPWTKLTPATPVTPTPAPAPTPVPPAPPVPPTPTPVPPAPTPVPPTPAPPTPQPQPQPQPENPQPQPEPENPSNPTPNPQHNENNHPAEPENPTNHNKTNQSAGTTTIPSAPASVNKLKIELANTLKAGEHNIVYAGKSNKITVTLNARADFLNRLNKEKQVKAYAYIYSNPRLLNGQDGTEYVTVHFSADGKPSFDAVIPQEYSGNHTIVLIDEQGNQVAWTNVLVKRDDTSQNSSAGETGIPQAQNTQNVQNTSENELTSTASTEATANANKNVITQKEASKPTTSSHPLANTGIQTIPALISIAVTLFASFVVVLSMRKANRLKY